MDKLAETVDFYDFSYQGKIHRMYRSQYVSLRAKQLETGLPDDFLDTFRKHMVFTIKEGKGTNHGRVQ